MLMTLRKMGNACKLAALASLAQIALKAVALPVQWQPLAAVLLTPYLVGNVVASLLLTTSWLTQFTSPPITRESTIAPFGGEPKTAMPPSSVSI